MDTKLYRLYLLILIIPFTLVGGSTPLKILVSWDYYSQYLEKNVPHPQSVPYLKLVIRFAGVHGLQTRAGFFG